MATDVSERQIPVPPDFPVSWDQPGDEQRFWERELQHFPKQVPVLDFAFHSYLIDHGFNPGLAAFDLPVRNSFRRFNTYLYQSIAPVSHDPAELEKLGQSAMQILDDVLPRQFEMWEGEYLPEIQQSLSYWESFDLEGAGTDELIAHLDETLERWGRAYEIHFRIVVPVLVGMSLFDDFYADVFGSEDALAAFRLLLGLPNETLEADWALYRITRAALASPPVLEAFNRGEAGDVLAELERTTEGSAVLANLEAYLEKYGKRHDGYISFSEPSWIEDPTAVIALIKDEIAQPDRDIEAEFNQLASEREEHIAAARERLAAMPEETAERFEVLLKSAQESSVLQEDHNIWIDGRVNYEVRLVLLEFGRRLAAAGVIDDRDDVFHLTFDELRQGVAVGGDLRGQVAERVAEVERFADVHAPPVLGTFPPGPPPDDPIGRAIMKMFGGIPKETTDDNIITGMAGSAGVVRGRARLIHSLDEADRLEPGDILVTETTSPPWTSLFAVAAAVVTDTGGALCHCALVAREYAIPAVVGTKRATAAIQDGQLVEVDGEAGEVRLVESA